MQSKISWSQVLFYAYFTEQSVFFLLKVSKFLKYYSAKKPNPHCQPVLMASPRKPRRQGMCCAHIAPSRVIAVPSSLARTTSTRSVRELAYIWWCPAKASSFQVTCGGKKQTSGAGLRIKGEK